MMMRIKNKSAYPSKINIEGFNWKIEFKQKITYEGDICDGLCDSRNRTISIRTNQDPVETFRIFIHECLHAIEYERNIDIPHEHIDQLDRGVSKFMMLNRETIFKILGLK